MIQYCAPYFPTREKTQKEAASGADAEAKIRVIIRVQRPGPARVGRARGGDAGGIPAAAADPSRSRSDSASASKRLG